MKKLNIRALQEAKERSVTFFYTFINSIRIHCICEDKIFLRTPLQGKKPFCEQI